MQTALTNLGVTVVSGNESDWLRITYEALKTSSNGLWSVDMTISNMATMASYTVTNVAVENATAYDASELYLGFYGAGSFAGNEGFEMDNLYAAVVSPPAPPPATGYDAFIEQYGLSGIKTDDKDGDGLEDWGEYVFGGNPDDGGIGDVGVRPVFDAETGDYIFSLIGDSSVVAYVLETDNLVIGSWVTNSTVNVSVDDEVLSEYTENLGTTEAIKFIKIELPAD